MAPYNHRGTKMIEPTDRLTQLTTGIAKLLDAALALPADTDRDAAARQLARSLIEEAYKAIPTTAA